MRIPAYDPPKFDNCKTSGTEVIVRYTVVGPMSQSRFVMAGLNKDPRVSIKRSGPYTDSAMFPKMDMDRFLFEVEVLLGGVG